MLQTRYARISIAFLLKVLTLNALLVTLLAERSIAIDRCSAFDLKKLEDVFARPKDNVEQENELKYIDSKLFEFINLKLSALSSDKRQRIIDLIGETKWQNFSKVKSSKESITHGAVVFPDFERAYLSLSHFNVDHPMGRYAFIHEIAHFIRLDGGSADNQINIRFYDMMMQRNFGLYREELVAFGFNYDFISSAYKAADLPRLRRIFPSHLEEDREFLESRGILVRNAAGAITFNKSLRHLSTDEYRKFLHYPSADELIQISQRIQRFSDQVSNQANPIFIESVEKIVTMSRSDYIKEMVAHYRRAQAKLHVEQNLEANLPKFLLQIVRKLGIDQKLIERALGK